MAKKEEKTEITVPATVIDEAVPPAETVVAAAPEETVDDVTVDRFHEVLDQVRGFAAHLVPTERAVVHALLNELQAEHEGQ